MILHTFGGEICRFVEDPRIPVFFNFFLNPRTSRVFQEVKYESFFEDISQFTGGHPRLLPRVGKFEDSFSFVFTFILHAVFQ